MKKLFIILALALSVQGCARSADAAYAAFRAFAHECDSASFRTNLVTEGKLKTFTSYCSTK